MIAPLLLLLLLSILLPSSLTLTPDGTALLAFKYSIVTDPASILADWNYDDETPCSWNGVVCMTVADSATNPTTNSRVIGLVLPNTRLVGIIPDDLGLLDHLRHLDLSGNSLNSTLPPSILNISDLRIISLAGNAISGQIPQSTTQSLQVVNLSGNGFTGGIPASIATLPNLTTLSIRDNFLTGELPTSGFRQLQVLDLSSNLLNGTIPADLSGSSLNYLNLSNNRLTGEIPPELGLAIPAAMTIDLSFNNLSGEVPTSGSFQSQKPEYFAGNAGLCGKLLNVLCQNTTQPPSPPPAVSPSMSPPAIAVIPKIPDGNSQPGTANGQNQGDGDSDSGGLSLAAIVAITVGDMAGIGLLFSVFLCVYRMRRKRHRQLEERATALPHKMTLAAMPSSAETKDLSAFSCCLTNKCGCGSSDNGSSDTATSEDEDVTEMKHDSQLKQQETKLVTLDGEKELEMETLLKASAYILGVAGPSIVYKAVLEDGTTFAVRRIGESGTGKMKDFESQIKSIAKLRHPNLLRLRGFYWAANEKLLISDYAPNGSLSNISIARKHGSSPFLLRWDARLRTARGIARGLTFLHEKRCVHGNLKPSNILLSADMEPWIADYGLDRLLIGNKSGRTGTSARHFGSKRSLFSQNNPVPDLSPNLASGGPSPAASSTMMYQAPESLQNLKPSHKCDVFSFGMVLLELMAGRVFSEAEVNEWNSGFVEEGSRVVRMADPAIRGDVQGKEEALLGCPSMEDFYDVKSSKIDGQTVCLFGIFDGHGGSRAAEYLRDHLFENLLKHPKFMADTKLAISETYQKTDADFLDAESNTFRDDGSTASAAVLVGNRLYVANVGDSRTVVSKAGKAIPLSDDHKPNRSDERQRIENAGGVVMWAGTWRVGGVLAMSRAFGNRLLKQFVVAEPEIQEQEINDELELLVLASDGLWDVVPNEDAVSLARMEEDSQAAARKLTETAFSRGSADNITCIVVRFHHQDSKDNIPPGSPSAASED